MPGDSSGRHTGRPSMELCCHYFSYLGSSGGHSAPLAAFWITVGRFLCVWDHSSLDFEVFWKRSGGPWSLFFEVFLRIWMDAGLFFELAPNTQKTYEKHKFFYDFRISCVLRTKQKKQSKIAPGACRTKLPTNMTLEPGLGVRWTWFRKGLGHSLVPLGRLWGAFGRFLAPLGQP